jgi:tetratricopeptide (TPR) repeat protein
VRPVRESRAARLVVEAERLAERKDARSAIVKYEDVLDHKPSDAVKAKALRGLATLHERIGHSGAALKYYQEYRNLAPSSEHGELDLHIAALRAEMEFEPGR